MEMTIAEGTPTSRPTAVELIHENAILGCHSWSKWKNISFEQTEILTWYHSPIPDMLFNSVLDADLDEKNFLQSLQEVTDYCETNTRPLAWLIPNPSELTDYHRNLFTESNYRECPGTTGMLLELANPSLHPLFLPKPDSKLPGWEVKRVDSEELLSEWANIVIESYQFPQHISQPWRELHSAIGYRTGSSEDPTGPWEHFVLITNGKIVATSSLFCGSGPHNASFANLAVKPSARGGGIGSYLVRESLARLVEYGYQSLTLYASQDAYGLYSRLGFTPYRRNTFFIRE